MEPHLSGVHFSRNPGNLTSYILPLLSYLISLSHLLISKRNKSSI